MKVLVTGSTGYIGTRLIPYLQKQGHQIYALSRSKDRIVLEDVKGVEVVEGDLTSPNLVLPEDIDAAYFLVHSMDKNAKDYDRVDKLIAQNFVAAIEKTKCQQVIYLTGLVNDKNLSKHLTSRLEVEQILRKSRVPLTALRAGIIIGAGSASFEIIRDLVEKLPIMVAPKWVSNKCQPISIVDVLEYLTKVLGEKRCYNKAFDIGGPQALTYKEMLLKFAEIRKLKRRIISVPVLTPKLSSYWLFFITSTNYDLAKSLVDSLKNHAVCQDRSIQEIIPKQCLTYEEAIHRAFQKIEQNAVVSSWRDSWSYSSLKPDLKQYIEVPSHGSYKFKVKKYFEGDTEKIKKSIFNIGGCSGWYKMNWAWKIRGFIDRMIGGVGLRRGKTLRERLRPGDALDFWRVLLVDEKCGRLLLYAEMKLPGEAWLEFKIKKDEKGTFLSQVATFRPKGLLGRFYWWIFYPFHLFIFPGMADYIIKSAKKSN